MSKLRVLFLDDDANRHRRFKRQYGRYFKADMVFTAADAIDALNRSDYDLVFLDHDLGGEQMVASEGPSPTGFTVVKWMTESQPKVGHVVVHSLNPGGAANMVSLLRQSDYSVEAIPFTYLLAEPPLHWFQSEATT